MLYNILEFKRILYFLKVYFALLFPKVDLGYLSSGNIIGNNVDGVFGNDNILSSGLVELRN